MMSQKQTLRNLLADDKITEVISQLRSITEGSPDLQNEVLQVSARFQQNEKQRRLDIAQGDDVNREYNKIRNALISIIDRLPDSSVLP